MSVQVNIPQFLYHLSDGVKMIEVEGSTVGECLYELIHRYPQLEESIFEEKGKLRSLLNVYINLESAYPGELSKPVREGDKLDIMYTLVGG